MANITKWILLLVLCCHMVLAGQLEANKQLVRDFNDLTNAADWEGLAKIVAPDFRRHSAATMGPPVTSRDQFIELQKGFLTTFADQKVEFQQIIAEGDLVAVLATYSATQTGPMGDFPATGKRVTAPILALFRIEAGQIAELWVEWDNLGMLVQLGLFPPDSPDQEQGD